MNKIIGLICGWGDNQFVRLALQQAVEYCDEVLVNVSPHAEVLRQYADSSYDIALEFIQLNDNVKFIEYDRPQVHADVKASVLNLMLSQAELFEEGNWIWTLDIDEFYPHSTYEQIKKVIEQSEYNKLLVQERYFYINTKHFLYGDHYRLFRIEGFHLDPIYRYQWFKPTQNWAHHALKIGIIPIIPIICEGMFHYGMLTNPWQKIDFWKTEYKGKTQSNKVRWIEYIYRNYDLNNEDHWVNENRRLFGVSSPWFSDSFRPNTEGKLFEYTGKHPKWIQNSHLVNIDDFRKHYEF